MPTKYIIGVELPNGAIFTLETGGALEYASNPSVGLADAIRITRQICCKLPRSLKDPNSFAVWGLPSVHAQEPDTVDTETARESNAELLQSTRRTWHVC